MPLNKMVRALSPSSGAAAQKPSVSSTLTDLDEIAQHMFNLMLRNITTDGYVVNDPYTGEASKPGCVIAAPSYRGHTPNTDQDYVYNWVRDAAITAIEVAEARAPGGALGDAQTLLDYVAFAKTCQVNAKPSLGHACFTVGGEPRPWTEQSDGPALQTLAVLQAYDQLDAATKATAAELIRINLGYLLGAYKDVTFNLWEEHQGLSFFARSVQLRCFRAIAANSVGIPVPEGTGDAITWLQDALEKHWNGSYYVSMLAGPSPGDASQPLLPQSAGYDPNIDIICASLYGSIPCTDTKLLATAARLRSQWADAGSPTVYPINIDDSARGLGPLLGRYPGDTYDGDMTQQQPGRHPWALCTCNLAELYYTVAKSLETGDKTGGQILLDGLSAPFFEQVGVSAASRPAQAAEALREAGDAMLRAVIFHSDHLELSEQFDGASGFEKSVSNLTWSYAAFLSAARARSGFRPQG